MQTILLIDDDIMEFRLIKNMSIFFFWMISLIAALPLSTQFRL